MADITDPDDFCRECYGKGYTRHLEHNARGQLDYAYANCWLCSGTGKRTVKDVSK